MGSLDSRNNGTLSFFVESSKVLGSALFMFIVCNPQDVISKVCINSPSYNHETFYEIIVSPKRVQIVDLLREERCAVVNYSNKKEGMGLHPSTTRFVSKSSKFDPKQTTRQP